MWQHSNIMTIYWLKKRLIMLNSFWQLSNIDSLIRNSMIFNLKYLEGPLNSNQWNSCTRDLIIVLFNFKASLYHLSLTKILAILGTIFICSLRNVKNFLNGFFHFNCSELGLGQHLQAVTPLRERNPESD